MSYVFLVIMGIYSGLIAFATIIWAKITAEKVPLPKRKPGLLSIVIPVRNEALNIEKLLTAIAAQNFSPSLFEVIVVDDHSEDDTKNVINNFNSPFQLKYFFLPEMSVLPEGTITGKKQAIAQGVLRAKGEVIITTDADCFMGKEWLQSIYSYFESYDAQMLVGSVTFEEEETFFDKLQTLEFAALIGSGAVALKMGKPNMCNGANLAFTKKAFEEVRGYEGNEHIPSGDDEFLLQKIYGRYPKAVYFNSSKKGLVYTKPAKNLNTFINQRRRWGGKWKLHKSASVQILALAVFLFHSLFIGCLIATLNGAFEPYAFATGFLVKASVEFIFLKKILDRFEKPTFLKQFVVLQCLYSFYVIVFGILVNFGSFNWKGRKYKN